jgi:hypothetical protein
MEKRPSWEANRFSASQVIPCILWNPSELSLANKVLLYKTILKPVWTYGIPLWGSVSHSNIEILQRFQNKVLRTIVNASWYIPNKLLHTDLQMPTSGKKSRSSAPTIELNYSHIRMNLRPTYLMNKARDDWSALNHLTSQPDFHN